MKKKNSAGRRLKRNKLTVAEYLQQQAEAQRTAAPQKPEMPQKPEAPQKKVLQQEPEKLSVATVEEDGTELAVTKDTQNVEEKGFVPFAYEVASVLLSAALIILIIFTFFARMAGVVGSSMEPTLHNGNWVILSQVGMEYTPEYGDIVVVSQPNGLDEVIIKRVIATGGQTVDIDFDAGVVYVDGKALTEPYTAAPTYLNFDDGVTFPLTVPEGYVFVMGDNRNDSTDSRSSLIGCIRNEYILGKVKLSVGDGIQRY